MKSKTFLLSLLIVLLFTAFQNSHSQTFTSVRYNTDSLLFDGSNVNVNYTSSCTGKVTLVKGCGRIIRSRGACGEPGSTSNASVGADVMPGDKIETCGQSLIEVEMSDGSVYRAAPYSEFTIEEAACDQTPSFSFRLALGAFWSEFSRVMGGDTKYEIKTENAVTGVRGTKFLVKINYDTVYNEGDRTVYNVNITTTVVCLEGIVEVGNRNGATLTDNGTQTRLFEDFQAGRITIEEMQRRMAEIAENNKLMLNAGMETTVYNEQPPSPPVPTRYRLEDFSPDNFSK